MPSTSCCTLRHCAAARPALSEHHSDEAEWGGTCAAVSRPRSWKGGSVASHALATVGEDHGPTASPHRAVAGRAPAEHLGPDGHDLGPRRGEPPAEEVLHDPVDRSLRHARGRAIQHREPGVLDLGFGRIVALPGRSSAVHDTRFAERTGRAVSETAARPGPIATCPAPGASSASARRNCGHRNILRE